MAVGAAAGVAESLLVALRHGYYFNTVRSLLSFLFVPAAAYAVAGALIGGALCILLAIFLRPASRAAGVSAALCVPCFVLLFWGSALQGRFFGTVGNAAGHVAMVALAVVAFVAAGRLLRAKGGRSPSPLILISLLIVLTAAVAGLVMAPHGSSPAAAATLSGSPRPNILLVTIDTLRADRTGYSGYRPRSGPGGDGLGTTPRLDALASRGAVFSNAIVPEVVTDPSHASLLTAVPPWVHGVTRNAVPLRTDIPVIAEVLSAAGYRTAAIVSVEHLDGHISRMSRGFHMFADRGWEDRYRSHVGGRILERHARTLFQRERDASGTAALASRWVSLMSDANDGGTPFFLWVHVFDPHMPYVNHETGRVFSLDERDAYASRESAVGAGDVDGLESSTVAVAVAAYDSEVRHADTALGTVLDALADAGRLDDTIVVVTADHGEHMNEARVPATSWFAHVDVYDEVCRVPLVIVGPGVAGGSLIERQVSSMDVAPTILSLAGVLGGMGGRVGLASEIRARETGEPAAPRPVEPLVTMANPHRDLTDRGVRNGRWKLIERNALPAELYDLAADPDEMVNLIHSAPPVLGELAAALAETPVLRGDSAMAATPEELDPALREMLEALGYIR